MTALGIALALLAAVADGLAIALQAWEARRSTDRDGAHFSLIRQLVHRPLWLAGTALLVLEWPLQVLALAFAPIAVVQPMLATSQLVLLWLARFRLGETVGRRQVLATAAIVVGLAGVVSEAPRHSSVLVSAGQLAPPLALIGGLGLIAFAAGRSRRRAGLLLIVAAGLSYAWVDFANKLLSSAVAHGDWVLATGCVAGALGFGGLAFLEENAALRDRAALAVSPLIGAVKEPLPVLMGLWAGIEGWGASPVRIAVLAAGLTLVVAGAAVLAASPAVAGVAAQGASRSIRQPPASAGV